MSVPLSHPRKQWLGASLCLLLTAAVFASPSRAAEGDPNIGVKVQPATPGLKTHYVIYYNREQTRHLYTRQFILSRRKADPTAGDDLSQADKEAIVRTFREDIALIFDALTKATKEYEAWGCKPAAIRETEEQGRKLVPVKLEDFGVNMKRVAGMVQPERSADGTYLEHSILRLNLRAFAIKRLETGSVQAMALTTAHELFHSIQYGYLRTGELWFKESTAAWAANQVYAPLLSHAKHMNLFALHMHRPLTFDDRPRGSMIYSTLDVDGRPYGACVFFHFLSKQHPDAKKVVIEAFKKAEAGEGTTAVAWLSRAVGDGEPMGPKFRDFYDRFAVGALLTDQAPPDCRVLDAPVMTGTFRERAQRDHVAIVNPRDLTRLFDRHYNSGFTSPETATINVAFAGDANSVQGRSYSLRQSLGEVAGCASRYYLFRKTAGAPDGASLDALVNAGEKDISLQGLWNDGGTWKVVKGTYQNGAGHRVCVPCGRSKDGEVFLIVTRYAESEQMTTYPMTLAMAEPPALKSVEVKQKATELIKAEWKPQLDASGDIIARLATKTGSGKLDVKAGEAQVRIEFTSPVKAGDKPLCTFGGREIAVTPSESDKVFTGSIPTSLFTKTTDDYVLAINARSALSVPAIDLPLDADSTTVAKLKADMTDWAGYERDRGVELTLRPTRPIDIQFTSINWKDIKTFDGKQMTLIYGEVKNTGDVTANNPLFILKGSSFNKSKFPLRTGLNSAHILEAGAVAPFTLTVEADNKKDNYEFQFDPNSQFPYAQPIDRTTLKLTDLQLKLGWYGHVIPPAPMVEIKAQITNQSDKDIPEGSEGLTVTFYDENGKIVGGGGQTRHGNVIKAGQRGNYHQVKVQLLQSDFASYQVHLTANDQKIQLTRKFTPGKVGLSVENIGRTTENNTIKVNGTVRNTGAATVYLTRPAFVFSPDQPNFAPAVSEWAFFEENPKPVPPGGSVEFSRPFTAAQNARITQILPAADLRPLADEAGPR